MHSVVVVALTTLVVSAVAQVDICSQTLDQNEWIWNKNYARKRSETCAQGYHCSNGQPVALPVCGSNLYFSLSLGVCVRDEMVILKYYFGVNTCQGENIRYGDRSLSRRRDTICADFQRNYANEPSQTRLYAADTENCNGYFNCQVKAGMDWFHLCPNGTYFDDSTGDCSLLSPPSRCLG